MANGIKSKYRYFDGQKSVDIWNGDEGWEIISGGDQGKEGEYYKFIPTLFRAVNLRAGAVSSMPFEIYKGNEVYDSSNEWENKVGFLPNPTLLLQLIESALTMCGRAYIFRDRNIAVIKKLRYHLPTSVTPVIDDKTGEVTAFQRPDKNGVKRTYRVEDYIYFWLPDPYVEVGPPTNYPAQAAANACGVLKGIDLFASQFFERGAIKAMLLTVKGMPAEAERQRLVDWWKRVVAGIRNAFGAQVINAEAITPVVIGEGMKELENVTIGTEKREDIAIAVGIPMSILFANAANYATSQQDDLNFLTKTIIPECMFIQAVLNEQLFGPLDLHFEFLPETLDAMQEDEADRAAALKQLVDAGFDLLTATEILGYELTDEQIARMQQAEIEAEKRRQEMLDKLNHEQNKPPEQQPPDNQDEEPPVNEPPAKMAADLGRWQRKALKALKAGKSANVDFESIEIPLELAQKIHVSLAGCKTPEEITTVFTGLGSVETYTPAFLASDAILSLAMELKRANDLLEATTGD